MTKLPDGTLEPFTPFAQAEVDRWTAFEELQHGYLIEDEVVVANALAAIDESLRAQYGIRLSD